MPHIIHDQRVIDVLRENGHMCVWKCGNWYEVDISLETLKNSLHFGPVTIKKFGSSLRIVGRNNQDALLDGNYRNVVKILDDFVVLAIRSVGYMCQPLDSKNHWRVNFMIHPEKLEAILSEKITAVLGKDKILCLKWNENVSEEREKR